MDTNASRLESIRSTIISYVSMEFNGKIIEQFGQKIGSCSVITAKTLAIREAVKSMMHIGASKIIVESDSQVAIKDSLSQARSEFNTNLAEEIKSMTNFFL